MTGTITIASVRKSICVKASQEQAFAVLAHQLDFAAATPVGRPCLQARTWRLGRRA